MASYTVPNGHIGAHNKTLAGAVVDTVTFALGTPGTAGWALTPSRVEILTDGAADIYVTTDGTAPVVAGTQSWRIPAIPGSAVFDVRSQHSDDPVVIKLVSSGTPTYSVSRA
jgi:hypothetical protein